MTTSGVDNYNPAVYSIITASLRKIGAIGSGETPGAQLVTDALQAMNGLAKEWDAIGIHVWTETEATLFLQPNQVQYALGPTSSDHATQSWVGTSLSLAVTASTTSIPVVSIAGISSGDQFGILLDTGFLFWTTVNGTPSGNVVHVAAGVPSSASAGNAVYSYTTPLVRPLRIIGGRRYNVPSQIETPLLILARLDYMRLPNKTNQGTVTQFYYSPQLGNGQIYLWPAPPSPILDAIKFTFYRQIQDFASVANTMDFPQEWNTTLIWNLAKELGPEYDIPPARWNMILQMAEQKLELVKGWDKESEAVQFGVAFEPFS